MKGKQVINVTYQGDLYRILFTDTGEFLVAKVFERGLNRAYELDYDELPLMVCQIVDEHSNNENTK